jgi:hypothetical protein
MIQMRTATTTIHATLKEVGEQQKKSERRRSRRRRGEVAGKARSSGRESLDSRLLSKFSLLFSHALVFGRLIGFPLTA